MKLTREYIDGYLTSCLALILATFCPIEKKSTFTPHCSMWMLKVLQDIVSTRVMSCHTIETIILHSNRPSLPPPILPNPHIIPFTFCHTDFKSPFDTSGVGVGVSGGMYSRFLCAELCVSLINYIYTGWSHRGAASWIRNFVVTIGL